MSCRMALEDRTGMRVSTGLLTHTDRMLTRIFRLLQVVHPLDLPGTPTMTEGFLINIKGKLNSLDAFHVILLRPSQLEYIQKVST